jgi:hypothetical protein
MNYPFTIMIIEKSWHNPLIFLEYFCNLEI